MSDPEYEKKKRQRDQEMAAMNTFVQDKFTAIEVREVRSLELLEQISQQLSTIEQLLRQKL